MSPAARVAGRAGSPLGAPARTERARAPARAEASSAATSARALHRFGRAAAAALAALAALADAPARATVVVDPPPERARSEALAEALRDEIVRALAECPPGDLVVRVRAELPDDAPRPHALVSALLSPAMSALAAEPERWPRAHLASFGSSAGDAPLRAARLGYDVLVDVAIRAAGNFLLVEGASFATEPEARHGSFSLRTRMDADLRSYLGGLSRVTERTVVARAAALPARGYLAMAAADLDGDGTTELALITASAVSIVRLGTARAGLRLVEVARAAPPPELPAAPWRARRPVATAVRRDASVIARSSELAAPMSITLDGGALAVARASGPCPDAAFPIDAGCAELVPGRDFFDDEMVRLGAEGPTPHGAPGSFFAHAWRALRTREGEVVRYEAIVTPNGRLAVRIGERSVGAVGYGTALAMADLDDDGTAELLASGPQPAGGGDRLTLLRAFPRGALHVVWRSEPLAGSVWIASSGDLDADGLEELLAIEEPADPRSHARLWIVR